MKIAKSTLANLSAYFLATIVQTIASLLLNPFIALNMSYNDYALTGYYNSFNLLILPLVGFSFIQYYSKTYFNHSEKEREKVLTTIVSAQLLLGVIQLIFIDLLFYYYLKANQINFPFFPYAILSFSAILFSSFYALFLTKLKFERKSRRYLIVSCVYTALWIVGMSLFVILLKWGALGFTLSVFSVSLLIASYSIVRLTSHFHIDRVVLSDMFLFCWPIILANLMEYVFSGLDRTFLEKFHDNKQLGLYNIAISISSYVTIIYTTLQQTFQPDIFEAIAKKNYTKLVKIVFAVQFINLLGVLGFILLSPYIVAFLTYGKYTAAAPFIQIIALKGISASLYFSVSSIIIALGYSKITLMNKLVGTIATYFLFKILIDRYAYTGAAWGQGLSYLIMFVISILFLIYKYRRRKPCV